ncbi:transcriptional regulator, TetR family [Indibacter alkaliphilus LW1]|uniref:Transcriptional regulator, TetR family n=1 Tax=Indibacter alkaliphilus (strain CCUG 57479 / KCTC 22604 / LW1) TaxID=1189612 RepID=S2DI01_INDAL|nr:TetR/AcrR family transcriptional regulator [Indibacter alkaliphilus]EOZ98637.1 transcriptional regulator, TetR family [Indibacter alkaliphilus LW1]
MPTSAREKKSKLILDVAIKLFTTKGFDATKMEDVAKMAGISKGLTYFYFKNKEDLYMAVTKKAYDELKSIFREIFKSKGKNGLQMITDLVTAYIDFTQENRMYNAAILNFMGIMQQYNDEVLKEGIDPLILESEHFQKLLEIHHDCGKIGIQMVTLGMRDGSIRPELQAELTFYTIWAMVIGYERLMGPVGYEGKEIKIHLENWKPGFIKLMQDMLKGTIQATKPQVVQASLF